MIYWKVHFCVYQCLHLWQKFAKIDWPSIKLQICSSRTIGQTPFERFSIIFEETTLIVLSFVWICYVCLWFDCVCCALIAKKIDFIYLGGYSYLAETISSCGSQNTRQQTRISLHWFWSSRNCPVLLGASNPELTAGANWYSDFVTFHFSEF